MRNSVTCTICMLMFTACFGANSASAQTFNFSDSLPDSENCNYLRDEIIPNVDSEENMNGLNENFADIDAHGPDGQLCTTLRSQRDTYELDPLRYTKNEYSKYGVERVFIWGNLCGIDYCALVGQRMDGESLEPDLSGDLGSSGEQCPYENDGVCDVPGVCSVGTDEADCSLKSGQDGSQSDESGLTTELEICNESWHDAAISIAEWEDGSWSVHGWIVAPSDSCINWTQARGTIYIYAAYHNESGGWAEGSNYFCVEYPGPFRYAPTGAPCTSGQESHGFTEIVLDQPYHTHTLEGAPGEIGD